MDVVVEGALGAGERVELVRYSREGSSEAEGVVPVDGGGGVGEGKRG